MPEGWSWLFGHSLVILKYTNRLPSTENVLLAMKDLSTEFSETRKLWLDMRLGYQISLIVLSPETLHLISNKRTFLDHLSLRKPSNQLLVGQIAFP